MFKITKTEHESSVWGREIHLSDDQNILSSISEIEERLSF
jgi:hypothetical protein